ncbi:hypothetical protein ACH36K_12705 [Clostridium sp. MB05]|uniref:hypothetical protein n=1 Tax=Clostridium sp. MB05 TaxID=3376682 RepID=UPI003981A179
MYDKKRFLKYNFINLLKEIVIGISNVIPVVSGGFLLMTELIEKIRRYFRFKIVVLNLKYLLLF